MTQRQKSRRNTFEFLALTLGAALSGASCGGRAADSTERAAGSAGALAGGAGGAPAKAGASFGGTSGAGKSAAGEAAVEVTAGSSSPAPEAGAPSLAGGAAGAATVVHGPGGTTITITGDPPEFTEDCSEIPGRLFETRLGPCLKLSSPTAGKVTLCYANPTYDWHSSIFRCSLPSATGTCMPPSRLFDGKCCDFPDPITVQGDNPMCSVVRSSGTYSFGVPTDTDEDFIPDIGDDCPAVPNFSQLDGDSDRVGDACDNCPSAYNPDQADRNHDGVGDACEAAGGAAGAAGAAGAGGAGG